ncbi:hypothetical protein, partial [Photobacterium ganghwense]|uniref:hypothetical protein n=1 Tax=Photobacterium ganghwense TaxID=320778 RepID=UPI001B80E3E4
LSTKLKIGIHANTWLIIKVNCHVLGSSHVCLSAYEYRFVDTIVLTNQDFKTRFLDTNLLNWGKKESDHVRE